MKLSKKNQNKAIVLAGILLFWVVVATGDVAHCTEMPDAPGLDKPIKHVTIDEIYKALSEAKNIGNQFNAPPRSKLTDEQKKIIEKKVQSIITTKKRLKSIGPMEIAVSDQGPGKQIRIESVLLPGTGFATIEKTNRKTIGSSSLLKAGKSTDILINLSEYIDGETIFVRLYKDDGDGAFHPKKDKWVLDKGKMPIFRRIDVGTKRDLTYAFYSNYISRGVPSLLIKEQLPGTKIAFTSINFGKTRKQKNRFFIVIRKNDNNFPGRIIGVSDMLRYGRRGPKITLQEPVANETLYAMVYKDNGDGIFNEDEDLPLRGLNNLPIIVEFLVIE